MMTLKKTDAWGQVYLTKRGLIELFYSGQDVDVMVEDSDDLKKYNILCKSFDQVDKCITPYQEPSISAEEYHDKQQAEWLIPDQYMEEDIQQWLRDKCTTDAEKTRVEEELTLYRQHEMIPVLRLFHYIVDTMRANNVLWGVGRGSSVSSYLLFLIGIHKINSLAYNLDIREFIKDINT